jgi:hypothetical protein
MVRKTFIISAKRIYSYLQQLTASRKSLINMPNHNNFNTLRDMIKENVLGSEYFNAPANDISS